MSPSPEWTTLVLILRLVAEGVGVSKAIQDIAQRALAGEIIGDEELAKARKEVKQAVEDWNKAVNLTPPELVTNPPALENDEVE